jgi:hypothetical protein
MYGNLKVVRAIQWVVAIAFISFSYSLSIITIINHCELLAHGSMKKLCERVRQRERERDEQIDLNIRCLAVGIVCSYDLMLKGNVASFPQPTVTTDKQKRGYMLDH